MHSSSEVVIAAAGSGKTRRLIDEALAPGGARALITTYTRENLGEIERRLWASAQGRPHSVTTMTWFEFLLREGIKPYQSYKTDILSIRSVNFISENPPFTNRSDFDRYYLDGARNVYSDAVSDLAVVLNQLSAGKVIERLESMYDIVLIDEVQDLAGWDLEFAELLLKSKIRVLMVGDPRQAVYSTNRSPKNKQFRGTKIVDWVARLVAANQCTSSVLDVSFRCNQAICDFADKLYPKFAATKAQNNDRFAISGVHLVHESDVAAYRAAYSPQTLRWSKQVTKAGPMALNFGDVKGREFDHVLIFPTAPITSYIENGTALADGSVSKFYVAVTRARHSVGIVTAKRSTASTLPFWTGAT